MEVAIGNRYRDCLGRLRTVTNIEGKNIHVDNPVDRVKIWFITNFWTRIVK